MTFGANMLKAAAVIGAVALAPMAANAVTIKDADGDDSFDLAQTLTLDFGATGTAAFDSTSVAFNFSGSVDNGGSVVETISMESTGAVVLTFGNLVTPDRFSVAQVSIDGQVLDLLANGNQFLTYTVASPFELGLNFVDNANNAVAGTYDFSIQAVPVPAAGLMLLTALGGLGLARRRRKDV